MHTTILSTFFEFSRTALSMCSAGILLFLIALWAARADIARARGLDKIVALSNLCFAIPLAVFVALHLSDVGFVLPLVRSSGLLFGIMMFAFVAMLIIPGALARPRDRFAWTLVFRESSFAGGAWILAGNAMRGQD